MNEKDIAEQAYKNGYEKALKEQKAEIERLLEEKKSDAMLLYASGLACEQVKAENAELQKQVEAWKAKARELEQAWEISSSNEVVLQKQVDELKKENYELSKRLVDEFEKFKVVAYEKVHKKAVKDTAREILQELCGHGTTYVKKWIKERYGVEVE